DASAEKGELLVNSICNSMIEGLRADLDKKASV
ncbi:MAG: hypothetical protein ACJA10_001202, partial [Oleispira sp.]